MQNLLKEKAHIKKIRPRFMRQKANVKMRISRSSYRAPKGLQSKMGDNKAGHRSQIKTGFGFPKAVRGLDKNGKKIVLVANVQEAQAIDAKSSVATVSGTLGLKKKIEVVTILMQKNVAMSNVRDAAKFLADAQANKKLSKEQKEKQAQERANKKEAALRLKAGKKADADKAQKADEKSNEDAKDAQKKENDKILTQKQ